MTTRVHTIMLSDALGEPSITIPVTGATVAIGVPAAKNYTKLITPAGTLATLTITVGSGTVAGQLLRIAFSQIITALTYSGSNWATTGLAVPTDAAVDSSHVWAWSASAAKWLRVA